MYLDLFVVGSKDTPATWQDCSELEGWIKSGSNFIVWSAPIDRRSIYFKQDFNIYNFKHLDGSYLTQDELDGVNEYIKSKIESNDRLIIIPFDVEVFSFGEYDNSCAVCEG